MKFLTKHFGEIDVNESKVITFKDSIPGFPDYTRFILLNQNEGEESETIQTREQEKGLICWMQSLDDGDVAFVLMDVCAAMPDYDPLINTDDIAELGEYVPDDFLVYNIAVVPDDIRELSVNLKAPVIINTVNKLGKQVVVTNEEYDVRHYIFKELMKKR